MNYIYTEDYLAHHGVKGMKWGVRKYQNADGSLTPAGMKRYGVDSSGKMSERGQLRYNLDLADQKYKTSRYKLKTTISDGSDRQEKILDNLRKNTTDLKIEYLMKKAEYKSKGNKNKEYKIHKKQMADDYNEFYRVDVNEMQDYHNAIKRKHGKEYADSILTRGKKARNAKRIAGEAITGTIIGGSLVFLGAAYVASTVDQIKHH